MIGQTAEIAPADKRIYALRDVTATVESIPLIVASILSKKLAEGIDALVLDVKVGRGAFMKDVASARKLARALVRAGGLSGKRVVALLTDMSAPLGRAVGNAIETREAIEVLRGGGPADLVAVTLALGAEMLLLGGKAKTKSEASQKLVDALHSGAAARTLSQMIAAQGGDPAVVSDPSLLALAPFHLDVRAPEAGYVGTVDPLAIGLAAVAMGAGRTRADQAVDPGVGIELLATRGQAVEQGAPLARLYMHGRDKAIVDAVLGAFHIVKRKPAAVPLVIERIAGRAG